MPSRREAIMFTDAELRAYMVEQKTLIIVSNGKNGFPHPMPMWFYMDTDGAYICTTFRKSQKVMNFKRDPKATLLVESGEEYSELRGVVVYADCHVIDDEAAVVDALININTKGQEVSADTAEANHGAMLKTAPKRVVLKFVPRETMSWDHSKLGGVY